MFLLITFCISFLIQSYFYLFLFRKYNRFREKPNKTDITAVSIVICAKNEAANLKNLLLVLAEQHFPEIQVVLVDDGSKDETLHEMRSFMHMQSRHNFKVEVLQIPAKDSCGKKQALSKGIMAATHETILLTDADCQPAGKEWISGMISCFSADTVIVLGYGAYEKIGHSFLNKLIRFETLMTALQYFSYAIDGKPYMGVGRNLAYKKSAFLKAEGFSGHMHIKSGDDDLFVSQIATSDNTAICDKANSFTISASKTSFNSWIRQKQRHITTAAHYSRNVSISLAVFYLSQLSFYALTFFAFFSKGYLLVITPLVVIRMIYWYATIKPAAQKLHEKDLVPFGPVYEISIIFIQLYIFLKNMISPPKYW